MDESNGFFTFKGYIQIDENEITASMEDYLEMIFRLYEQGEVIRISKLSEILHVKPSSASKMVVNLKEKGFVEFEKYGYINLTDKGIGLGKYLLFRHNTISGLLCYINDTEDELEQVEKIEHFINLKTVNNMKKLLDKLRGHP